MQTYSGNKYKNAGKLLYQIAVERSFQAGAEGRVQLTIGGLGGGLDHFEAPGYSGGFHESFGFAGQDVHNPDGSLHHQGQEIHQKLAESLWDDAQMDKSIANSLVEKNDEEQAQEYWPPKGVKHSRAGFMSSSRPEMFLPDEVIKREKPVWINM